MISIKDYAKKNGVTYEAVRQSIKRYSEELEPHIHKQGRVQYLDDVAVTILNEHRSQSPIVVYDKGYTDRIKELEAECKQYLMELNELHKWKEAKQEVISSAEQQQLLLDSMKGDLKEARDELVKMAEKKGEEIAAAVKEAQDQAEKEKAEAVEEAIRLVKEEHVDKLKKMSVWEFLKEKRRK